MIWKGNFRIGAIKDIIGGEGMDIHIENSIYLGEKIIVKFGL